MAVSKIALKHLVLTASVEKLYIDHRSLGSLGSQSRKHNVCFSSSFSLSSFCKEYLRSLKRFLAGMECTLGLKGLRVRSVKWHIGCVQGRKGV